MQLDFNLEHETLTSLIERKALAKEQFQNFDQEISKCKLRVWMASIQKAVLSGKIVSVYQNNPSVLQLISFIGKWSFHWTDSKNSPMIHLDEYWMTAIQSLFTGARVECGYAEFNIKKKNSTQNYPFDSPRKKWKFVSGEATSFKISKGPHVSPCRVNSTFMDFPHNVHLPTKTHKPHYLDIEDKFENGELISYSKSLVPVFFFWDPAQVLSTCATFNQQLPTPLLKLVLQDYLPIDFIDYYNWCF